MSKKKILYNIAGNIASQHLSASSRNYNNGGHLSDWLYCTAKQNNITKIEIDVLKNETHPKIADIKQLYTNIYRLENIIENQLLKNGIEKDFIVNAILKFDIDLEKKIVYCKPFIEDINGEIYSTKKTISKSANPINNYSLKNSESDTRGIIQRILDKLF